jgi:hypothetical protein
LIKPEFRPWFPFKWHEHLQAIYALKALQAGEATKDQQQVALDFLIKNLCATYDMSYMPDSDRDTAFAEGKRWVGNQVIKLLKLTGEELDKARQEAERKPRK